MRRARTAHFTCVYYTHTHTHTPSRSVSNSIRKLNALAEQFMALENFSRISICDSKMRNTIAMCADGSNENASHSSTAVLLRIPISTHSSGNKQLFGTCLRWFFFRARIFLLCGEHLVGLDVAKRLTFPMHSQSARLCGLNWHNVCREMKPEFCRK